jgi:hypothetical protein
MVGDALQVPADLALIGSGRGLIQRIEQESGQAFQRLTYPEHLTRKGYSYDGLKRTRILSAPAYSWRQVVALGARPSRRIRTAYLVEWMEAMLVLPRRQGRTKSVLLVPFQTRPVQDVAKTLMLMVWCMHRLRIGSKRLVSPTATRIVDAQDVSLFEEFATSRWAELAAFINRQLGRQGWAPQCDERGDTEFEIEREDLPRTTSS